MPVSCPVKRFVTRWCFIIRIDVMWFDCFYCCEVFSALNCLPSPLNIRAECASSVLLRRHFVGLTTPRKKKQKWRLLRWNRLYDVPVPCTQPYSHVCIRSHLKIFFPSYLARRNGCGLIIFVQHYCVFSCYSKTKDFLLPLLTILDKTIDKDKC